MALPARPSLSVVIVAYGAREVLPRAIQALAHDTSWPHRTIVLLNGAPGLASADLAEIPAEFEIWDEAANHGYAGAINLALERCDTDLVGIWNDDAVPRPNALGAMVTAFGWHERISAVTASIINQGEAEETANGTLNLAGRIIPGRFTDRRHVLYPSGAAMLLRRDLPLRCDPDYFLYYEDVYLGLSARLQGYFPVLAPDAKVDHVHHASVSAMDPEELAFYRERNRQLLLWTLFSDATLPRLEGYWRQERELRRLSALVGKGRAAALDRAEAWIAEHPELVQQKREQLQATRTVDDDALLAHFSYRLLPASVPGATVFNKRAKSYCRQHGLWTWDLREESGDATHPLPALPMGDSA